mmetsp:Transcript_23640/g.38495  ORF Transcript_23640/g.38495 Transcript_23640/m.38495 type:complete len:182 (+) Transcript_23640:233-778(+)|eukprot:scaffold8131_cov137-Skeletonema_menzelii.AAC.1
MKQFSSVKEAVRCVFSGRHQSSDSVMHEGEEPLKDITVSIPTFSGTTEAEEVDISEYTEDDLERLRLDDPFLYYSIPGVKRKLHGSDSFSINTSSRSTATLCSSRRSSCPTIGPGQQQQQQQQRRESVTRARRLSVEHHPSVVVKRIMDEMKIDDDSDDDSDVDEESEKLIQALSNGTFDL